MSEFQNEPNDSEINEKSNRLKVKDFVKEAISWVMWLGGALLMALFLNNAVIVNAEVVSGSMEKTIMTGDRVLGLRIAYLFSEPKRLDIVVFNNPIEEDGDPYVKRIIGLPGETVLIANGKVYINGSSEPLNETYLHEEMREGKRDYGPYVVPEDSYFVMGDNRNGSADSREWGYLQREDIIGKIYFDLYPNTKILK